MLESVLRIFPVHIRERAGCAARQLKALEEIRIRIGQPIEFLGEEKAWYLSREKEAVLTGEQTKAYPVTEEDMQEMVTFLSRYSPYAFSEEIKNGYITLEGGHRVGIAGQVRMEQGDVADICYIRFLDIRIAREQKGCAKELVSYLRQEESIYNTLFVSAPGIGKSTYLRDCIRLLSDGGLRVSLVDERSEIAACHMGRPQNDVGLRTDVLDRCSKPAGMRMMLRAMSPQVLAVDELGTKEDFEAVEQALNCGCKILGTIHAGNLKELSRKENLRTWVTGNVFERYVLLKKGEHGIRSFTIYNGELERIC